LELSERAEAADVVAIVGLGASPGISNLLAAVAMRSLDRVDRVLTGWRAGDGIPKPNTENSSPKATAAIEHWIHQCAIEIRVWREGAPAGAAPLEELKTTYPGAGSGTVWTCGHPEPLTIPTIRPEIRECLNVMVSRPGLIEALRRVVKRVQSGELDVPQAARALILEPDRRGPAAGDAAPFPGLFGLAEGVRDGRSSRVAASLANLPDHWRIGEFTGYPLAIGAGMIAAGNVDARGVLPPEAAIDPDEFFTRLAELAGCAEDDEVIALVGDDGG
ncbi:MAG: hypothetical protein GEU28_15185, partial [Dehalococcoidia bacterium]|nr:hypothetical protein [Dehalococcoidia bacterium]